MKEFEGANKTGKLLAWQLKKKRQKCSITKIIERGKEITEQQYLKREFYKYYATLLSAKPKEVGKLREYLERAKLSKIPDDIKDILNKEITLEEVYTAIEKGKRGKSPGPDGLMARFYKVIKEKIGLQLQEVMNLMMTKREMPPSWNQAAITLIPKENSDSTNVKNYRPISLLNLDYKVFAKILANRLQGYFINYIKEEQMGFLPGRHLKDNIRTMLNVIEYYLEKEIGLVFLDAKKSFDNLAWNFMMEMLTKMEIGMKFINAIGAIYREQQSYLIINTEATRNFKIGKGTHQGCPLSPLLFIFVLEFY